MTDPVPLGWPASRDRRSSPDLDSGLMTRIASGDAAAFSTLYDRIVPNVFGLVRQVLRNPAQSEEVAQEVMIEVWRTATRYDPLRGTAKSWILTIAHRRAIDRVRSEQAAVNRETLVATRSAEPAFDQVADTVTQRFEVEQVRRCLDTLTDLQREAITLAYYNGYTYPEVAIELDAKLPTIKARMRDGLIRLRDCLGPAEGRTT